MALLSEIKVGNKIRIVRDNDMWNGMEGIVTGFHKGESWDTSTYVDFEIIYNPNHRSFKVGDHTNTLARCVDVIGHPKGVVDVTFNGDVVGRASVLGEVDYVIIKLTDENFIENLKDSIDGISISIDKERD